LYLFEGRAVHWFSSELILNKINGHVAKAVGSAKGLGNPARFLPPKDEFPAGSGKPTASFTKRRGFQSQDASFTGHSYTCINQLGIREEQFGLDFGIQWRQGFAMHKHSSGADIARPAPPQVTNTFTVRPVELDFDPQIKAPVLSSFQSATEG
jgi:hypothetical protein